MVGNIRNDACLYNIGEATLGIIVIKYVLCYVGRWHAVAEICFINKQVSKFALVPEGGEVGSHS